MKSEVYHETNNTTLSKLACSMAEKSAVFAAMLLSQCIAVWILLFGIAAIQNTLAVEKEIDGKLRCFDVYLLQSFIYENSFWTSYHPVLQHGTFPVFVVKGETIYVC